MVMLTGGFCEIAISVGDKSTGMQELLKLVGEKNANVLMGAGDSGNDVPLRSFVTGEGAYFSAAPTAALLEEFKTKKHLEYDKEVFKEVGDAEKDALTLPGLWFQLAKLWNYC
eukprot:TRINITY_DN54015_c0_g1_i1.p2 TRINITY_DN54015_c0_g1~~TRINITY_DN54015_c0_g1_i1.p2  ORF type:complete len:113 (-),score=20.98 TRINITY_DN54015_c0_g1_i1:272-610(-)